MSEDWQTKYGTRRVRRDPPTLEEAIFAAAGITDDHEAQAEIAAALMGMPIEPVLAEVKKASRHCRALRDAGDYRRTRRAARRRGRAARDPQARGDLSVEYLVFKAKGHLPASANGPFLFQIRRPCRGPSRTCGTGSANRRG